VCYYLVRHTPILARVKANRIQGDLLRFSLPLVVSSSAMIIFSDIDVFMLGAMTELGDVGVYNVIYPIAQLLTAPLSAFGFIFMPFASAYDAEDKAGRFSRSYQVVTKWVFLLVFPVFLVISLFPTEVIQLTFGSKYAIGGTALTVLAAGFLANAIGGMNRNVLTALGETRHVMIINVLGAGVNVALNLLLIPRYSYLGAAIATTGSLVFLNAVFSAEVYRQTGAHPFTGALLRPVVAALGLVIGLYALVVTVFEPTLVSIVVMFCLFGILYIVAIVRFGGIEPEEISLLEDMCEEYNVNIGPLQKVFNVLRRGR
jgi:O-antigen/teichoic acid export membrane protein